MINILQLVRRFFKTEEEFREWLTEDDIHGIPISKFEFIKNNMEMTNIKLAGLLSLSTNKIKDLKNIIKGD